MISIIIPALNEEKALPETLGSIFSQSGNVQIIIVDGDSSDRTQMIARENTKIELIISKRGRSKQMNVGAAKANGEWLLFLHADTLLPKNAIQKIQSLTTDKNKQAGCFRQRFSKDHWFLRFVSFLHNWRCRRTRIMYGDQAMFIRKQLFESIGGFPEQDILEDVLISELIVAQTNPVLLDQGVITSSRKFEQRGLFRSFFDILIIMGCYELRLPIFRKDFFSGFR